MIFQLVSAEDKIEEFKCIIEREKRRAESFNKYSPKYSFIRKLIGKGILLV
jgi:hypothetical protein